MYLSYSLVFLLDMQISDILKITCLLLFRMYYRTLKKGTNVLEILVTTHLKKIPALSQGDYTVGFHLPLRQYVRSYFPYKGIRKKYRHGVSGS